MTITIPRPVAITLGVILGALTAFVLYEEGPPLYRYLFKFERM